MKLILISLNGVRLPSAIPLDRVAATRGGYRRSVLAREHVRERERKREPAGALSAPRRVESLARAGSLEHACVYELSATVIHLTAHHVCAGEIFLLVPSPCAKKCGGRGRMMNRETFRRRSFCAKIFIGDVEAREQRGQPA